MGPIRRWRCSCWNKYGANSLAAAGQIASRYIDSYPSRLCMFIVPTISGASPHMLDARRRQATTELQGCKNMQASAHVCVPSDAGGGAGAGGRRLSAPARAALQGMFNEARGRMDEAQQWYEGTMEKAALDQGALKRQIAQVLPCLRCSSTLGCESAAGTTAYVALESSSVSMVLLRGRRWLGCRLKLRRLQHAGRLLRRWPPAATPRRPSRCSRSTCRCT
jgi:hypothetical protein